MYRVVKSHILRDKACRKIYDVNQYMCRCRSGVKVGAWCGLLAVSLTINKKETESREESREVAKLQAEFNNSLTRLVQFLLLHWLR